jgi:hypothetical protein
MLNERTQEKRFHEMILKGNCSNFSKYPPDFSLQLIATKPSGMWDTRFPVEYKEKYGEDLPLNYGEMLQTWTDIIRIEQ